MKEYLFGVQIFGRGETPQEAFEDALSQFLDTTDYGEVDESEILGVEEIKE